MNWIPKNKKNVEKLRMSRFLLHLRIYLWTLFYFGIKSYKIEHNFETHDYDKQAHFPLTRLLLNCGIRDIGLFPQSIVFKTERL